jgi:ribosomal protein S12 methylthiotransferase accessory factor
LVRVPRTADGPELYQVGCEAAAPLRGADGADAPVICGGAGPTEAEAVVRCLGEAVERYCARLLPEERLRLCAAEGIAAPHLDVSDLVLFSGEQYAQRGFPFARPGGDTPLHWVRATCLTDGREAEVPAFLVYMPYPPRPPEPAIAPAISTGLACGTSREMARLAGLLECVERDAVACTWLGQLSPPRIAHDESFPDPRLLPQGGECRAYEITSDFGIPTALVVLRGRSAAGPTMCIGSAAAVSLRSAAGKALSEAAMSWTYATWLRGRYPDWDPGERFENVTDFSRHAQLYAGSPELHDAFRFLDRSELPARPLGTETSRSPAELLEECVSRVRAAGLKSYAVDLTSADIAGLGFHVARVVCPKLQPLNGSHSLRFLGPGRLWHAAEHFSFAGVDPTPGTLNPYPHPSA